MNAHTKFDVNLKAIIDRLVKASFLTYPVSAAEELAMNVPPIKQIVLDPSKPIGSVGVLFAPQPDSRALQTDNWIVEHHNLVSRTMRAGFIQITPAGELDKAHKVYGFGYQVVGGYTKFSPLYAIQVGTNWFPGFRFFSRTSPPEKLGFPDRPEIGRDLFSRVLAAN